VTQKPYTEIYLVRHCHPDYRLEKKLGEYNMPLSKTGEQQRKYLTKKLLKMDIDSVYASGLCRAQETAAEFIAKTKKTLIIDERLDEINWKYWHRIKYFNMSEEAREKRLVSYKQLDKRLDRIQTEARCALSDLFRTNRGKKILVFSHGNFIKAAITSILNADVIGFLSLEIFQSSISQLVIDRSGYIKVTRINDVSHLPHQPEEDLFLSMID